MPAIEFGFLPAHVIPANEERDQEFEMSDQALTLDRVLVKCWMKGAAA
jgi:hypothetical protein